MNGSIFIPEMDTKKDVERKFNILLEGGFGWYAVSGHHFRLREDGLVEYWTSENFNKMLSTLVANREELNETFEAAGKHVATLADEYFYKNPDAVAPEVKFYMAMCEAWLRGMTLRDLLAAVKRVVSTYKLTKPIRTYTEGLELRKETRGV